MREIGQVKLVQVQRWKLKVNGGSTERFDPAGIMAVDGLLLTSKGAIGITSDEMNIVDVHHADHTHSRNNGTNSISIGFTGHYNAMRERFGSHLMDGIAGENIHIDAEPIFWLDDLHAGVCIQSASTGETYRFDLVKALAPCEPFSQFCAGSRISGVELKETLQFLSNGRRGFSIIPSQANPLPLIRVGDRVFLED